MHYLGHPYLICMWVSIGKFRNSHVCHVSFYIMFWCLQFVLLPQNTAHVPDTTTSASKLLSPLLCTLSEGGVRCANYTVIQGPQALAYRVIWEANTKPCSEFLFHYEDSSPSWCFISLEALRSLLQTAFWKATNPSGRAQTQISVPYDSHLLDSKHGLNIPRFTI